MRSGLLILGLMTAAALGLRLTFLEILPIHTDEAVHGFIVGHFLETGLYRYDPVDYHGPSLNDLAYVVFSLCHIHNVVDLQTWHLRALSGIIGVLAIASLFVWVRELGRSSVITAMGLMTLGAPFVYYHRYFIHEGLFVALSLLLLHSVWCFLKGDTSWQRACLGGLVAGLLLATKETSTVVILATTGALVATVKLYPLGFDLKSFLKLRTLPVKFLVLTVSVALLVAALLYSSFGGNPHGLIDAVVSLLRFSHRASGEGHEHPFLTYLHWLLDSNHYSFAWFGWITVVLAGVALLQERHHPVIGFLGFFTAFTFFIYSAIAYKTPWLLLNLIAPLTLLAGVGAVSLHQRMAPPNWITGLLALLLCCGLFRETRILCFEHPADPRNPLAYSPTSPDIETLVSRLDQITSQNTPISVISEDYWPLPWVLRHHPHIGYWNQIPESFPKEIVITSPTLAPALQARLGSRWHSEFFGQRAETLAILLFPDQTP